MIKDEDNKNTDNLKKKVKLTAHELRILEMMITNKNEKFIAEQMRISQETVKTYIEDIYLKTGTDNFGSLIDWALSQGLVSPNF